MREKEGGGEKGDTGRKCLTTMPPLFDLHHGRRVEDKVVKNGSYGKREKV